MSSGEVDFWALSDVLKLLRTTLPLTGNHGLNVGLRLSSPKRERGRWADPGAGLENEDVEKVQAFLRFQHADH